MPITYNKGLQTWELKDPTEDEKEALLNHGVNLLIEFFGEQAAQRIFEAAGVKVAPTLESMDTEVMGNA